jgi:hypothetical protein
MLCPNFKAPQTFIVGLLNGFSEESFSEQMFDHYQDELADGLKGLQ